MKDSDGIATASSCGWNLIVGTTIYSLRNQKDREDNDIAGQYEITVIAGNDNPLNESGTRLATLTPILFVPGKTDEGEDFDPLDVSAWSNEVKEYLTNLAHSLSSSS